MLRLIGPRVLVRRLATGEQTRTGLWLPSSARELPAIGEIVAIGSSRHTRINDMLTSLKVGSLVMFPKMHDRVVELAGERLLDLRHDELIAEVTL